MADPVQQETTAADAGDACCTLSISPDGLEVLMNLDAAKGGGAAVERGTVLQKLAEMGVCCDILETELAAILAAGCGRGVVVARGRPPVHGRDGWLEPLLPEVRSRVPREDETGHIDYRDLGDIFTVSPGDRLMQRHSPTEGVYGKTVLGVALPAQPGKPAQFAANLTGAAVAADNPDLLVAAVAGQPVVVRDGVIVEQLYKVKEVNAATGNINFDGSVVIEGDVLSSLKVVASGDIEIGGIAEMCTLEAGGNIKIKGGAIGVLGNKSNPQSQQIRCGGNFSAAFAQQARIEAGDSIFIDDMAMQCDLVATNHIVVGHKKRGHIIGGHLQATLSITGKIVGSPNRSRTQLGVGVNPGLHKLLQEKNKAREAMESQLLEVSKLLAFAKKNPGKLRPEMIEKAQATYSSLWDAIAAMRSEAGSIEKKIELTQQARIRVLQAVYDGVEVSVGNQRYRVVGEHGACAIWLGTGQLGIYALEEQAAPSA